MADEDEIDVLGDFNLDILSKSETNIFDNTSLVSQNSDLLNCDYTIHPQWLLDRPSTNPALWYSNSDLDIGKQFDYGTSSSEPQIPTSNSITDESGWTEKEKNLLHRGIEIFGKSNINLSQFIGSRTPAEVRYFFNNFYSDVQASHTSLNTDLEFDNCTEETVVSSNYLEHVNEILDDNQIPASIEEVIAAVSTAKPTLITGKKKNNSRKGSDQHLTYDEVLFGQSLLKSSYTSKEKYSKSLCGENTNVENAKPVKFKFKTKIKVNPQKKVSPKKARVKKQTVTARRRPTKSETEKSVSESGDVQIITGNGLAVPVCEGEEVIKIRKENETEDSDTDIEIDVEDFKDDNVKTLPRKPMKEEDNQVNIKANKDEKQNISVENVECALSVKKVDKDNISANSKIQSKKIPQLTELDEDCVKELTSMEFPQAEIFLAVDQISALEKFIFYEFFERRPSKTPMRYLQIRNHIINAWNSSKPNYVTKTSIRHGLRHCGDVNCIGRIHNYLEQIGAINYACEQTNYSRPLYDLVNIPIPKEKTLQIPIQSQKIELLPRQRNKKKYVNDGEGGCTLTHDERGDIINTTVINEEPPLKQRTYIKKPTIRLIYCRPFNETKPQEYSIKVELSALILMDLHAHMYLTEVMGLIGGYWNSLDKELYITKYVPCKNIAPSTTHCDMCPITQARAAEILHGDNLDILGWFHSHPTFAPEPSQQDIDTQLSVQRWIGSNKPCIGFILSPFSLHGALIASPFRCLIVDKKENFEDQLVPYKFKVELVTEGMDVSMLLKEAKRVMHCESNSSGKNRIDFKKPYFQDTSITYLDKYVYSVKMHLAKCSNINKMTCDAIIEGLSDICSNFVEYSN